MTTEIKTSRGSITTKDGKAELVWNTNFKPRWHAKYSEAQIFVDREVLRGCEPYTPLLTGMLIMSGALGTDIGSGKVSWIAPYARRQYYTPRKIGTQTGPLRGPFWFERWKQVGARQVIEGARKIVGAK